METAACEIARLPEELLTAIISLTSPPDACRAAAVSWALRAAADSDAVWSCFVPRDLPQFVASELSLMPPSKKAMFLRLSDNPALLLGRLMIRMWLDKVTGAKCYTLPARALQLSWGDTPRDWRWIHLKTGKTIFEATELLHVGWLEIRGRIHRKMLSQNLTYAAYMVFKLEDGSYGLDYPFQEASVSVGGNKSTRRACLQGYVEDGDGAGVMPREHIVQYGRGGYNHTIPIEEDVLLTKRRADGWMELELGEFYNEEGGDDEVCTGLTEMKYIFPKNGLIVRSIEIRVKQQR